MTCFRSLSNSEAVEGDLSSKGGVGSEADTGMVFWDSCKSWPHLLQKLLSGGCVEPQFGHDMSVSVDEPHFLQKLDSSGFSVWHFGHFIIYALQVKRAVDLTDKRTDNPFLTGLSVSEILLSVNSGTIPAYYMSFQRPPKNSILSIIAVS